MRKPVSCVITIFLSLVLLMISSLIFTLLESARSEGLRLRTKLAVQAATESAFAMYDKPLWDECGVLAYVDQYGDAKEMERQTLLYARKNAGSDWLSPAFDKTSIDCFVGATDANGDAYIKMLASNMTRLGLVQMALDKAASTKGVDIGSLDDIGGNADGEISFDNIKDKIDSVATEMENAREKADVRQDAESGSIEASGGGESITWQGNTQDEDEDENRKKYDDLLEDFSNLKKKGLLMLVLDDVEGISEAEYDNTDFPSQLSDEVKERCEAKGLKASSLERILAKEYYMQNFDSYTSSDKKSFELEYLLCGKSSDLANISSAVKRLVGIRMVIDYLKTRSDAKRISEALAIATAVVGWTCIPSLVTATKEVILIIWALKDAISDVRKLADGNKVSLMNDGKLMLSYTDYLRVLLCFADDRDLSYRAMDIMQMKIRRKEPAFLMKRGIIYAKITLYASSSAMFPYLPGLINYDIRQTVEFSYIDMNQ